MVDYLHEVVQFEEVSDIENEIQYIRRNYPVAS